MSAPYLTPSDLVMRSMVAMSEAMDFVVTDRERAIAHDLDQRVVERIRDEHPDLSVNGRWAPNDLQTRDKFDADRDRMLGSQFLGEYRRAVAFLLLACGRRKTINRRVSSYGLKHSAERRMRELNVAGSYLSNGALITAAIALQYRVEHIEGTPNCFLDVTVVRKGCR